METITHDDLYRLIALHMAGYFGANRRIALRRMAKMHEGGILLYWSQSASASVTLAPRKTVYV